MSTLHGPNGVTVIVPEEVVEDYEARGWARTGLSATPSDAWTVKRLRGYARTHGIAYQGLRKDALLAAVLA